MATKYTARTNTRILHRTTNGRWKECRQHDMVEEYDTLPEAKREADPEGWVVIEDGRGACDPGDLDEMAAAQVMEEYRGWVEDEAGEVVWASPVTTHWYRQ